VAVAITVEESREGEGCKGYVRRLEREDSESVCEEGGDNRREERVWWCLQKLTREQNASVFSFEQNMLALHPNK